MEPKTSIIIRVASCQNKIDTDESHQSPWSNHKIEVFSKYYDEVQIIA